MSGIVVGAKKTADGREAVRWALQEALARGTTLYVVRTWSIVPSIGYGAEAVLTQDPDDARREAAELAEEVVAEARKMVPGADAADVRLSTVAGPAGPALARAAVGRSLVVVGSRHAGRVSRALVGSVTEYVLHHATCPVAIVPSPRQKTSRPPRVIVGVDHSPASLQALAWAAEQAVRRKATLVPVLCRDDIRPGRGRPSLEELEGNEVASLSRAVPDGVTVDVEPQVAVGRPGKALLHLAEPQDLLVVGSRGRNETLTALLGSTGTYLAEHAHCPVVVLREHAAT